MLSLKEKLDLWVKITGVNPAEEIKKYTIYLDGKLGQYDIVKMNERIQEALKYDESGTFAEAYLEIYLKEFLNKQTISITQLLENAELSAYIEDVKRLHAAIREADATTIILDKAKKAMAHYQVPCNELDALSVMELFCSAKNCIENKLDVVQFSYGTKGNDFKVSTDIYAFDSLDALVLCSAKGKLNGVTLGYIQNKEQLTDSYFAFIIKNGDNLYLLTDMPKYTHPAQSRMSRCPGRNMSNRIESNWFPYETVAKIDISDLWDKGRYGTKQTTGAVSTMINEELPYAIIGTIQSLSQVEAFWFVTMIDLIKQKFYDAEAPRLELSYTKSMISSTLLEETSSALIVKESLPSMSLNPTTIEETNGLHYDNEFSAEDYQYAYLVERYKDEADQELLNVIKGTPKHQLIEDQYQIKDSWGRKDGCEYLALDLDHAGTEEEILYQQKWIARYNFAKAVRSLNEADYQTKKQLLQDKIEEYITPRLEELVTMHLQGVFQGLQVERSGFAVDYTKETEPFSFQHEFNKWYNGRNNRGYYHYGFYGYNKSDLKCAFTKKTPTVVITINPRNANELALMCGIKTDELPLELQHYERKREPYYGNCILNNIDPFLWLLKDAFNTMNFSVAILLSKKKYLELCVNAGVEPIKFWENETPVCFTKKFDKETCDGSIRRTWEHGHFENHIAQKCLKCKYYDNPLSHDSKQRKE